jgi:hypothetical protein
MYLPIKVNISKGTHMSLVKFNTTTDLNLELDSIKRSRPDCNTNAAAAKHAIKHYLSECEQKREVQKSLLTTIQELQELREQLQFYFSAQDEIKRLLKP